MERALHLLQAYTFKKKRFLASINVMITHPIGLEHFLPSNLLNNHQLYMLKQPWMCKVNVGLHNSDAMKQVKRPFCGVDHWHKVLELVYFVLQVLHCNIYRFSKSVSKLTLSKKTLTNQAPILWLPSWTWACIVISYISSILAKLATTCICMLSTSRTCCHVQ